MLPSIHPLTHLLTWHSFAISACQRVFTFCVAQAILSLFLFFSLYRLLFILSLTSLSSSSTHTLAAEERDALVQFRKTKFKVVRKEEGRKEEKE